MNSELQRIYVKHILLETASISDIFRDISRDEDWNPDVKIDLKVKYGALEEAGVFEVVLSVAVEIPVKTKKKGCSLQVEQAGIFQIEGFDEEEREYLLNTCCPEILFPYAREAISNLVFRASLPPLNIMPINFESLYAQQRQA